MIAAHLHKIIGRKSLNYIYRRLRKLGKYGYINMEQEIEQAKDLVATAIVDNIKVKWRNRIKELWRVYMVGGGSLELGPNLEQLHKNIVLIDDVKLNV